ncbi:MAG: SDR family oxidoreductase [Desulfomonilaceae bacterium]|nr:SDR family oxidoreductase [Desulfomonilaceae bacterium]
MNYVVVGATAGLGRRLVEGLARRGADLTLVSSDPRDLDAIACDVRLRYEVNVQALEMDLGREQIPVDSLVEQSIVSGMPNGLILPVGAIHSDDVPGLNIDKIQRLVRINFLSVVEIVQAFLPMLRNSPGSCITAFGSVAASRGRCGNVHYSASKRALESYFQSLRHCEAESGVIVQFYTLGYMDTSLAYGMNLPFAKADPGLLSSLVIENLHRDIGFVYYPKYWRLVCTALKMTPWFIHKRMRF